VPSTLRVYRTGICALGPNEVERDRRHWPSLNGAGFSFEFRPRSIDAERKELAKALPRRSRQLFRPPELHIISASAHRANSAALLLYSAHSLIEASLPVGRYLGWEPYLAIPVDRKELAAMADEWGGAAPAQPAVRIQTGGVVDIAGLAARLSRRTTWTQATFFYLASLYLVSVDSIDLHPGERDSNYFRSPYTMHRV
jgi:hypothetical protein